MGLLRAFFSGVSGSAAVYGVHVMLSRWAPGYAPQMHRVTAEAMARGFVMARRKPPGRRVLKTAAKATDIAGDALMFSIVGIGDARWAWLRGLGIGALAGASTVALSTLGTVSRIAIFRRPAIPGITVAIYAFAGLVAGLAARLVPSRAELSEGCLPEQMEGISNEEPVSAEYQVEDDPLRLVVTFEGH